MFQWVAIVLCVVFLAGAICSGAQSAPAGNETEAAASVSHALPRHAPPCRAGPCPAKPGLAVPSHDPVRLAAMDNSVGCDPHEGLQARLIRHEGWRACAYLDSLQNWTIGVGHLLKRPVPERLCWSDSKILAVLDNDIDRAEANAEHDLNAPGVWAGLRRGPREVLIEMSYQLGGRGLLHFKRMLAAVRSGDLAAAADEMLDSRWAKQTPRRAQELSCLMEAK